ncbi:hypothetical protein DCM91_10930 [Chitinophaga costaii]|nr:hypothetical protein DCM91_10930 [Chitinophaga costaii]
MLYCIVFWDCKDRKQKLIAKYFYRNADFFGQGAGPVAANATSSRICLFKCLRLYKGYINIGGR